MYLYMGNRIRLEIVWLRINWETVQTQGKKKIIGAPLLGLPKSIYYLHTIYL